MPDLFGCIIRGGDGDPILLEAENMTYEGACRARDRCRTFRSQTEAVIVRLVPEGYHSRILLLDAERCSAVIEAARREEEQKLRSCSGDAGAQNTASRSALWPTLRKTLGY